MTKPVLTLWVQGGLGNRFRAIESAISLCKKIDSRLQVIWPVNDELGADLHQLICPFADIELITAPKMVRFLLRMHDRGLKTNTSYWQALTAYDEVLLDDELLKYKYDHSPLEKICSNRNIFIRTCHKFYFADFNFSWVKPVPAISKLVDAFRPHLKQPLTGVHVRRTDHVESITHSTDESFIEAISKALSETPEMNFFFCSDDAVTEKNFRRYFGDRLLARTEIRERNSLTGIRDAMVDWLLLSECPIIFHSYHSSFSETAAWKGNAKLKVI